MASKTKYVEFTSNWKIRWADYDRIGKGLPDLRQYFVTSFENVSFRWYAALIAVDDGSKVVFRTSYDDGPLEKIEGAEFEIDVVVIPDRLFASMKGSVYEYARGDGVTVQHWECPGSMYKNSTAYERTKYGRDHITYQITFKIPIETFAYSISSPAPSVCAPWSINLFNSMNNDDGNSPPADTKVAGRDGVVFECHKLILAAQSKALRTIFYPPPSQNESAGEQPALALEGDDQQTVTNPSKKRKASAMGEHSTTSIDRTNGDVYDFPNLSAPSLKSMLEYLYTGKPTIATLTTTELIELGDAGEQYDLNTLKAFCIAELWKRVIEEPASAFEIARFADQHDDLKYLKHRALDVIAENYERLGVKQNELAKRFGGMRGDELHNELVEYMRRQLRPKKISQ